MKPIDFLPVALVVIIVAGISIGIAHGQTDMVIKIKPPRTAVDLAFVVERDADDKIVKIHRFILWSNGDVTFPNIPYYAKLLLNCRDCPKVPNPCPEDIDGDGVVAQPDLLALLAAMGKKCP